MKQRRAGGTSKPINKEPGIESFIYIISGHGEFQVGSQKYDAPQGAYIYTPPDVGLEFHNSSATQMKAILYKRVFIPIEGKSLPPVYYGNVNNISYREYDSMSNVFIKDLLPVDIAFDMNMHILSFAPGGCHPFVETHVQEHGAYILEGEGCYYIDDQWTMIKQGDYVWLGPYVAQAAYGVGTKNFTYIYSKDCHRDVQL
ncbi:MAG: (S)-ureidoglycine aminohydrolase [Bacillota bacterium]